jgi:3-oxoacyl-[acyl-carrier-protein] synthase II
MSDRRVVVTGMGAVTPFGDGVDALWDGLICGQSGIRTVTRFDCEGFTTKFGGECTDFDPTKYLPAKNARRLDRYSQLAFAAAAEAAKNSGIDFAKEDPRRMGALIGSGIGGLMELEDQHVRLRDKGPRQVSAFTIPKLMANAAAGHISIEYGIQGPTMAIVTACASATNAMGEAMRSIRRGECDVIFTGGTESALTPLGLAAFGSMKAMSTRNDEPKKASRPFDKDRDGFVMSEGAGILIFEDLEHAQRRGAEIYAEVLGYGLSSDAYHIVQPAENGHGAADAMRNGLADARINADELQYINAHGTSTPLGDIVETRAIKQVFGQTAKSLMVSSTKSSTGHLLGASGGVELIATVCTVGRGAVPPTINLDTPGLECDLDYVPNTAREKQVQVAMNNSFGFGGHNACIVIGRHT